MGYSPLVSAGSGLMLSHEVVPYHQDLPARFEVIVLMQMGSDRHIQSCSSRKVVDRMTP